MQDQWIRDAKAFVLVYAIDKEDSFEEIQNIKRRIDKIKPKSPIVIVGNKADLDSSRKIGTKTGEDLANTYGVMFIETSARTGANCEDPFRMLVRELRSKEKPVVKEKPKTKKFWEYCNLI